MSGCWLFDLGNSRLKLAEYPRRGVVDGVQAFVHDGQDLPDDWPAHLPERFDMAVVSSVASDRLRVDLLDTLVARCGRVLLVSTLPRCAGVTVAYPEPRRLGVDRFLSLLGAHGRARQSQLIVGVGTALTVDLLDATGRHLGGRIAPSPALMRQALHRNTARLPAGGGRYVEFADDTADALQSGCEGAALGLIERSRASAERQLGQPVPLLLHGGGAEALAPRLDAAELAHSLVLEGLGRWADMSAPA